MNRYLRVMRGMALASVLMVIALAVIIAFAMAGLSISHLHMTAREVDAMQAQDLAETAVSDTLSQISAAIATANTATPPYESVAGPVVDRSYFPSPNATCVVAFKAATAHREKMLQSFNNWGQKTAQPVTPIATPPYGSVANCPPGDVLVSAKATVNGVTKYATALVAFPSYQFAISSQGPILSGGGMVVASTTASPGSAAACAWQARVRGGNIASNNSCGAGSIVLHCGDKVMGNAVAVGRIVKPLNALIMGSVCCFHAPVGIPHITVSNLDPNLTNCCTIMTCTPPAAPAVLSPGAGCVINGASVNMAGYCPPKVYVHPSSGHLRWCGCLNLPTCGMLLYVEGNLTVTGGVKGKGVVIVDGTLTIGAGGCLTAKGNEAALIAKGCVCITGSSATNAAFQGLVYTNGNFSARNITLVGAFVGGGCTSTMHLCNTRVVNTCGACAFNFVHSAKHKHHSYGCSGAFFEVGCGFKVYIQHYSCGKYSANVTGCCSPTSNLCTLWNEIAKAICYCYTHGNHSHFGCQQIAYIHPPCGWQNRWPITWEGHCGGVPSDIDGCIASTCSGPARNTSPTSTSTTTTCCTCYNNYHLPLDKFFQPDGQARILLWEVI